MKQKLKWFIKRLVRKGFSVGIDEKPKNYQELLRCIEEVCKEEKDFMWVQMETPILVMIEGICYTIKLRYQGNFGYYLHFQEV